MCPQQLAHYGDRDAADLAAAYAFGLVRSHAYADGNKVLLGSLHAFLPDNGYHFKFDPVETVKIDGGASIRPRGPQIVCRMASIPNFASLAA